MKPIDGGHPAHWPRWPGGGGPKATQGPEPRPWPAPPPVRPSTTNCPVPRNPGETPGQSSHLPHLQKGKERAGRGRADITPLSSPGVSGAAWGRGCTWAGHHPFPARPFPGRPVPPLRHLPSRPQAPTYAAQLPIEVVPAGSLAGRVQPAQRFQHDLLPRREGAARPPCASRRHGPRRPGVPTPTASGRRCLRSAAHAPGLGSALRSRPRCRQRAHSPDPKNRPGGAPPRPGSHALTGERTLAAAGVGGGGAA